MYRLIFLNGKMKGRRVAVQQGSIVIGRDPSCHLALPDADAAPRHATIEERGGAYFLCGTDITNRIIVNGRPAAEAALKNGDKIEVGTTQLEFQIALDHGPVGTGRRPGGLQMLAVATVACILLAEGYFVLIAPLRQKQPVFDEAALAKARDAARARKSAGSGPVAVPPRGDPDTLEARKLIDVMAASSNDAPAVTFTSPVAAAVVSPPPMPEFPVTNVVFSPPPVLPPAVAAALTSEFPRIDLPAMPDLHADDLVLAESKRMLQAALARAATGDVARAEQMIDRIQLMSPDFVPAYVERARLLEKLGNYRDAFTQWQQVERLAKGTPQAADAKAAQMRMVKLEMEAKAGPPKPKTEAAGGGPVRIVSIERERFQTSSDYDEMRMIRVNVRAQNGATVNPADVRIAVTFYDRDTDSGKISVSRAVTPASELRLDGQWPAGESKSVTATYTVPKNFRAEELRVHGEPRIYEGYRIQVFHKGGLVDEDASPRELLALPAPKPPASAALPSADTPMSR